MYCQSKLKIRYVLFWSYYGPGRLEQNWPIKGSPQDVACRRGCVVNEILPKWLNFKQRLLL